MRTGGIVENVQDAPACLAGGVLVVGLRRSHLQVEGSRVPGSRGEQHQEVAGVRVEHRVGWRPERHGARCDGMGRDRQLRYPDVRFRRGACGGRPQVRLDRVALGHRHVGDLGHGLDARQRVAPGAAACGEPLRLDYAIRIATIIAFRRLADVAYQHGVRRLGLDGRSVVDEEGRQGNQRGGQQKARGAADGPRHASPPSVVGKEGL